jgi:ABC-2 type transport system permease protein
VSSDSFVGARVASAEAAPGRPGPLEWLRAYLYDAAVIAEMELRKLRHEPSELLTRAVQPALWLVVFGQAVAQLRVIPGDARDYLTFLAPGILAQSVMFVSIFNGLTVLLERDQGILQKLLAMPVPRASYVAGKALGAGARALVQGVIVLALALLLGVQVRWSVLGVASSLLAVVVGASLFASVSMLLAIWVRSRERFMGLGQVVTMPLLFASNAIYPIEVMPPWLQVVAHLNPLSYLVDLLRGALVTGDTASAPLDWAVLLLGLAVLQLVAARTCHRVVL